MIPAAAIACEAPRAIDGDTIACTGLAVRIRLAGIDAPELGDCRRGRLCAPGDPLAARRRLARLLAAGPVACRPVDLDRFGRIVARCAGRGRDLSCAMLASGHAIARYRPIDCPERPR